MRGRGGRFRPALAGLMLAFAFVPARAGMIRTYFMVTAAVVRTHRSRVAVQAFTLRPVSRGRGIALIQGALVISCSTATSYTVTLDSGSGAALAGDPMAIPGVCVRANQIVPISNRIQLRPTTPAANDSGVVVITVNY